MKCGANAAGKAFGRRVGVDWRVDMTLPAYSPECVADS